MDADWNIDSEDKLAEIIREMSTVAVIGMQDEKKADRPAFQIPQMTQAHGIRVIPVNPALKESLGEKAYASLAEIPDPFDTVNIFRRSEAIEPIADEILALPKSKYPKWVWLQTGIWNEAAAKKLTEAGIGVVMDRCLGVYASRYRR